jgi:hypothetical protein
MKKDFVIVSIFAILMLFVAFSPVMAEPAQKFSVVLDTKGKFLPSDVITWTTNGGIILSFGQARGGPVFLTIDTNPTIEGTYLEISNAMINTKINEEIMHFNRMVCAFPGGSFEGAKTAKFTLGLVNGVIIPVETDQHAVLHGSGIYEGQTLKIEQHWALADPLTTKEYRGILIVP